MAKLLRLVDVPTGKRGRWSVERFTVSKESANLFNLQSIMGGAYGRGIDPGTYTRLIRVREDGKSFGDPMMSDTPAELRDHWEPVHHATGRVLIAGLGIGVVLQGVLDKPEVTHATVVEIDPDIIALVDPHYQARYGDRLTIIQADIRTWRHPKGEHYAVVWFDIWPSLNPDNLKEMGTLKRRFARCSDWRGCWSQAELRYHVRRDRRSGW